MRIVGGGGAGEGNPGTIGEVERSLPRAESH